MPTPKPANVTRDVLETYVNNYVSVFGRDLPPNRKAAAKAVMHAIAHPDSLVRITCTSVDQIGEVWATTWHIAAREGVLDRDKSLVSIDLKPTIELINGSGIVFDCEWKSPHTGKVYSTVK